MFSVDIKPQRGFFWNFRREKIFGTKVSARFLGFNVFLNICENFEFILDWFCVYMCLYVRPYVCLYVCPYVCLYMCPDVCLFVWPNVCPYVCLYVCPYMCLFVYPYVSVFSFFPGCLYHSQIGPELPSLVFFHYARWGHWFSYPMPAEVNGSPTRSPLRSLVLLPDARWGHWFSYPMPAEVTGSPTRCPLRSLVLETYGRIWRWTNGRTWRWTHLTCFFHSFVLNVCWFYVLNYSLL